MWIALAVVVAACTAKAPDSSWSPSELIGYEFTLISKTDILSLYFQDDKNVCVTFGNDVAVTGPIMPWKIGWRGTLIIKKYGSKTQLEKLSQTGDRYIIRFKIEDRPWQTGEFSRERIGSQKAP
jgi:hypothetical protein